MRARHEGSRSFAVEVDLSRATPNADRGEPAWRRRSFWIQQVRRWHWISSALCLAGMLLFAATGLTLNHAVALEPQPRTTSRTLDLPAPLAVSLKAGPDEGAARLPEPLAEWIGDRFGMNASDLKAEWTPEEVTLSAPRPGGERAIAIDRASGAVTYETSSRGAVGALNDLHTGRNAGPAWSWFIDVFAIGCLVFATTGLVLLCLYAVNRPLAWPLLAAGAAAPAILVLMILLHML